MVGGVTVGKERGEVKRRAATAVWTKESPNEASGSSSVRDLPAEGRQ